MSICHICTNYMCGLYGNQNIEVLRYNNEENDNDKLIEKKIDLEQKELKNKEEEIRKIKEEEERLEEEEAAAEEEEEEEEARRKAEEEERLRKEEEAEEEEERIKEEEERLKEEERIKEEEERLKEEERIKEEEERLKEEERIKEEEERLKEEERIKEELESMRKICEGENNYNDLKNIRSELLKIINNNCVKDNEEILEYTKNLVKQVDKSIRDKVENSIKRGFKKCECPDQDEITFSNVLATIFFIMYKNCFESEDYNMIKCNVSEAIDAGGVRRQIFDYFFTCLKENFDFLKENKFYNGDSCGHYSGNICVPNCIEYFMYRCLGAVIAMYAVNGQKCDIKLPLIIYKMIFDRYDEIDESDFKDLGFRNDFLLDEGGETTFCVSNKDQDCIDGKHFFTDKNIFNDKFFDNLRDMLTYYKEFTESSDFKKSHIKTFEKTKKQEVKYKKKIDEIGIVNKNSINFLNNMFESKNRNNIENFDGKDLKKLNDCIGKIQELVNNIQKYMVEDYSKKSINNLKISIGNDLKEIGDIEDILSMDEDKFNEQCKNNDINYDYVRLFKIISEAIEYNDDVWNNLDNLNNNLDKQEKFNNNNKKKEAQLGSINEFKVDETLTQISADGKFGNLCKTFLRSKGVKENILSNEHFVYYIIGQFVFTTAIRDGILSIDKNLIEECKNDVQIFKSIIEANQKIDLDDMKKNMRFYCLGCKKTFCGYNEINPNCKNKIFFDMVFNTLEKEKETVNDDTFQKEMGFFLFNLTGSSVLHSGGFSGYGNKPTISIEFDHQWERIPSTLIKFHTCFNKMSIASADVGNDSNDGESFRKELENCIKKKMTNILNIS